MGKNTKPSINQEKTRKAINQEKTRFKGKDMKVFEVKT